MMTFGTLPNASLAKPGIADPRLPRTAQPALPTHHSLPQVWAVQEVALFPGSHFDR